MSSKKHRPGPSSASKSKSKAKPKKTKKIDEGKDYIFDLIVTMEDIIMLMKDKLPEEIIRKRNSSRTSKSSVLDVYKSYLARYKSVVEITPFKVHGKLFLDEYENHRTEFLNIMKDDSFLLNPKGDEIQIWYGKDIEETRKKNCRIPISLFYRYASEMQNEVSKKMDGTAENDAQIQAMSEYTIGAELLYCFLLVVREAAGPGHRDYKAWTPILKNLALEAHIGSKNNDYRGLDGLINGVMNAVGRAGYTDDNGNPISSSNRPSVSGIGSLVEKILDGDELPKALGGMNKELNKGTPGDINSALSNVTKAFLPKVADILIDSTKPPEGVHVTPESQRQAEMAAENMRSGIDKLNEAISTMDLSGMVPKPEPKEPESDTDPGSESDSGSESELSECSDSDSSDSEA